MTRFEACLGVGPKPQTKVAKAVNPLQRRVSTKASFKIPHHKIQGCQCRARGSAVTLLFQADFAPWME